MVILKMKLSIPLGTKNADPSSIELIKQNAPFSTSSQIKFPDVLERAQLKLFVLRQLIELNSSLVTASNLLVRFFLLQNCLSTFVLLVKYILFPVVCNNELYCYSCFVLCPSSFKKLLFFYYSCFVT